MLYEFENFESACEYVVESLDPKFGKTLDLVNLILATPYQYTGQQAAFAAIKIAGYRTFIGLQAQHWKLRAAQTKKLQDRLVKDALLVMYDGLLEVVNCLKLVARQEHELIK